MHTNTDICTFFVHTLRFHSTNNSIFDIFLIFRSVTDRLPLSQSPYISQNVYNKNYTSYSGWGKKEEYIRMNTLGECPCAMRCINNMGVDKTCQNQAQLFENINNNNKKSRRENKHTHHPSASTQWNSRYSLLLT